ncbi:MAG: chemotaxis protein CheW [Deltaproteobacteria bacterium]|nr:chemotaxis protein CheW [Deltaproteobacteria bacterium]
MSTEDSAGDIVIFELNKNKLALELSDVDKIIEVDKIFLMPGAAKASDKIRGVISNKGEAVVIVNLATIFNPEAVNVSPEKIIILKERVKGVTKVLGLSIGEAVISFFWKNEITGGHNGTAQDASFKMLNWKSLYDRTVQALAS